MWHRTCITMSALGQNTREKGRVLIAFTLKVWRVARSGGVTYKNQACGVFSGLIRCGQAKLCDVCYPIYDLAIRIVRDSLKHTRTPTSQRICMLVNLIVFAHGFAFRAPKTRAQIYVCTSLRFHMCVLSFSHAIGVAMLHHDGDEALRSRADTFPHPSRVQATAR